MIPFKRTLSENFACHANYKILEDLDDTKISFLVLFRFYNNDTSEEGFSFPDGDHSILLY